jgi:hypothetical protein
MYGSLRRIAREVVSEEAGGLFAGGISGMEQAIIHAGV